MSDICGCCGETTEPAEQILGARPGLDAIPYRVGTHGSFLAAMLARLSSAEHPDVRALTTRESDDPAIALLDAWACIADVLTFYQERIANEGYLRTATERRSVLELARLIGYELRPGVAASTFLAFTLESTVKDTVIIPAGTRAQSVPGPERLKPQPFETGEPLEARAGWSIMRPLLSYGQGIQALFDMSAPFDPKHPIYLKGMITSLAPGMPIVADLGNSKQIYRLGRTAPDAAAQRTRIELHPWVPPQPTTRPASPASGINSVPLPPSLEAPRLRSAVRFMSTVSDTPQDRLAELVRQAAGSLLGAIKALVAAPASPGTDRALDDALASLRNLRATVQQLARRINSSQFANAVDQVRVWLDEAIKALEGQVAVQPPGRPIAVGDIVTQLRAAPLVVLPALRHPAYLTRDLSTVFAEKSTQLKQVQIALLPQLDALPRALNSVIITDETTTGLYAMRLRAAPFGHNLPKRVQQDGSSVWFHEWNLNEEPSAPDQQAAEPDREEYTRLFLDNAYEAIARDQFVAILAPGQPTPEVFTVRNAVVRARTAYGVTAPTTELTLDHPWWDPAKSTFATLRGTVVYAQSEFIDLGLAPDDSPLATDPKKSEWTIDLDTIYDFLGTGRRLVVAGERADLPGVQASELVILAAAEEVPPNLPGETYHTRLHLQASLRFSYRRATAIVYGNVVPATHGETRREVLGSGDAGIALQRFTLRQSPLTYLAAPTAAGAESTLELRVDDVRWHEAPRLTSLRPTDRRYILRTSDDQKTTVIFGDGKHGSRVPTGSENVRAIYRTGIGTVGNAPTDRITLLATRPFGVKSVTNPIASTGGADPQSRDQARRNAPLAVMSLDRLVSVQDYADFARTYAGIGKAAVSALSDGTQRLVYLTIAGADDIPIAKTSELYTNLVTALRRQGDPYQPFVVELRELVALFISARVQIDPDYLWEKVEGQIRASLTDRFSFDRRELAQDVTLGELISTIQAVPGVTFVDVDLLAGIDETTASDTKTLTSRLSTLISGIVPDSSRPDLRVPANPAGWRKDPLTGAQELLPAQLVYLPPTVPELLHLEQLP